MPKNIFQDMVKINQTRRRENSEMGKKPEAKNVEIRKIQRRSISVPKYRHTLWIVAVIAVVFFLFALSYLFSNAEIAIDPKVEEVALNENLSASLDEGASILTFDLVVISGEESKILPATLEKEISQNARGTVVIYNTYSSTTQKLDINTRLEGSNGKIYKTEKALIVPGMKGTTPGSVEVKVYATEAGEEYNSTPLDFKIFGFKGTAKYEKFYARSKGEITGGFKGLSHVASPEDKTNAVLELKNTLQAKLLQKATDQIPSGFVLFKDAVFLEIDDGANIELLSPSETLPIKLNGTLYGILFEEKQLAKEIAKNKVKEYDDGEVYISNIKDITFSLTNADAQFKDMKSINFNLSGSAKIVWKLDTEKLISELLGKKKKDFKQILSAYPNVNSADLSLSPIWNRSIPDKAKDVKIIVNYPE